MFWQSHRRHSFTSLRWRLSLSYAALVLVVTALLTGVAVHTAATISLAAQREQALSAVIGVASAFSDALGVTLTDPAQAARQQGLAANGRVLWLGPDDRVRIDSFGDARLSGQLLPLPADLADPSVQRAAIYTTGDNWVAYAAAPLALNGRPAGRLLLIRDLSALRHELTELQQRLWLLGGALTLVFICVGLIFSDSLAKPLERVTLAVRRMQAGELHQSVPLAGSREMVDLATAFNDMAARVAALDEQRRSFVADAAHELRTPLASLRALAEGMNEVPGPKPEGIDGFIRQTERLGRLVGSLLTLARLDNPELRLNLAPIRMSNLVQEACWTVKPLAAARQVQLQTEDMADEAWVHGDPDWLHQALVNVLDNAIRYAPTGGWVRLAIGVEDGLARISIEDSGAGVPAEALSRLGTRFYRPAAAREHSTGGNGLGLAIVREVLRLHGGHLVFTSGAGHGLCVTMVLPVAPPEQDLSFL